MYILIKEKKKFKKTNFKEEFYSYKMPNKNGFHIDGNNISNIILYNKKLAHPFVSKVVEHKFNKLIDTITDILVSDDSDDDGDVYRESLNLIEKFRLLVKKKYRYFLKKKELEKMSYKLKLLQKESMQKLLSMSTVNIRSKNPLK